MKDINLIVCFAVASLVLGGCANSSAKTSPESRQLSPPIESSNKSADNQNKTASNSLPAQSQVEVKTDQVKGTDNDSNVLSELIPYVQTWIADKNAFKTDVNSNLATIYILPTDDLGALIDHDYPNTVNAYKMILADTQVLNKDTSNIQSVVQNHPSLQQNTVVSEMVSAIVKVDEDVNKATNIIGKELDFVAQLIKQFNNGSSSIRGPYWTFSEWEANAKDEQHQALIVEQDFAKIKTQLP